MNIDSQAAKPADATKDSPRGIFSEATLLAVLTALSYAVAYSFEIGVAQYFGYPLWLIDLSIWQVLRTFAIIVVMATLVAGVVVAVVLPLEYVAARPVVITLYAFRATILVFAFALVLLLTFAHPHFSFEKQLGRWSSLVFVVLGAALAAGTLVNAMRHRGQQSFIGYWETKNAQERAAAEATKAAKKERDTVMSRLLSSRWTSTPILTSFVVLFITLTLSSFSLAGDLSARWTNDFLVSNDSIPLVAIRRYSDYMVVAEYDSASKRIRPAFRILPLGDIGDRRWTRTFLPGVTVEPLPAAAK